MAEAIPPTQPLEAGLSGHTVRGVADNLPALEVPIDGLPVTADQTASLQEPLAHLDGTVHKAADFIRSGLDLAGQAVSQGVEIASDKIFSGAANPGPNIADSTPSMAQSTFSWSGYFQAIGILCLLLAALWFLVWCIRRYGKFNFLPRPGALPKESLVMEAQMPLGPKKGLVVVRFLDKRLLLGVTEHQISLLSGENIQHERQTQSFQGIMDEIDNAGHNSGSHSRPSA